MPRGAKLTPKVEGLIAGVCIEHPEWISKPKKIQQEVIRQLPDSLRDWGGPNWPGVDVIKDRVRKKIRPELENRPPESKRLDEPWSIGCLAEHEYDIPPEALPRVLQVWVYTLENKWKPLTIRQVKWVARLSYVVKDLASLYTAALDLAQDERITEITGVYLMDTATHETLYTLMTGKKVNLDTETLRSIALKENEEWLKTKAKLEEAQGKQKEADHERSHNQEVQE